MWYTQPAFWIAIAAVITAVGGVVKSLTASGKATTALDHAQAASDIVNRHINEPNNPDVKHLP